MKPIVLITGVSREMGLGYETARQMAASGWQVIITARELDKALQLATPLQAVYPDLLPRALDITEEPSVKALAHELDQAFGRIDVLINNAAAYFDAGGDPLSTELHYVEDALKTNLLGAWRMMIHFVPLLRKSNNAHIINVSSGAGSFSDPVFGLAHHPQQVPVYGITKLALNGLTVKMAHRLKEEGIKVNAVCPGFVATSPGMEAWGARPVEEGAKGIVWAASQPEDGASGAFFRDGQLLSW